MACAGYRLAHRWRPSPTSELPEGVVGPAFGETPGSAFLISSQIALKRSKYSRCNFRSERENASDVAGNDNSSANRLPSFWKSGYITAAFAKSPAFRII